jgi:DNA-binding NtrC family response regulator
MPTQVLLIDDEPADLLAIAEGLRQRWQDVVVDTTDTAEKALEMIAAKSYDLTVSDVRLPGMDGVHFTKEAVDQRPDMPIVLFTAAYPSKKQEALRHGASAFVEKPLDLDDLVRMMKDSLRAAALRRRVKDMNAKSAQDFSNQWRRRLE